MWAGNVLAIRMVVTRDQGFWQEESETNLKKLPLAKAGMV